MDYYKNRVEEILRLNNFLIKLKSNPTENREEINEVKRKLKKLISLVLSYKD